MLGGVNLVMAGAGGVRAMGRREPPHREAAEKSDDFVCAHRVVLDLCQ